MTLYKNKYSIESFRLKNWDYRNAGAYFITICTQDRVHFFGEIVNGEMQLNETGKIAYDFWDEIPTHFAHVQLGEFVIMPNHIHGILILIDSLQCNESTRQCNESTSSKNQFMADISPKSGSVSTIIRSFKSACTKQINRNNPELNFG